jgi:hypothetical protein
VLCPFSEGAFDLYKKCVFLAKPRIWGPTILGKGYAPSGKWLAMFRKIDDFGENWVFLPNYPGFALFELRQ